MTVVNTYSPSEVTVVVGGYILTGLVKISFVPSAPRMRVVKGIRGQNTRVQNYDTSGVLTLEVLQSSNTNDILTELLTQDQLNQSARIEVQLKDGTGRTRISSSDAFVSNYPQTDFSDEVSNRKWDIECLSTNVFVGGNSKPIEGTIENFKKWFK